DDAASGVDAAGEEGSRDLPSLIRQLGRVLPRRDRVKIDDTIDAVEKFLERNEFGNREIITEMKIAGRLHAGKHPLLERHIDPLPIAASHATAGQRDASGRRSAGASSSCGRARG